MPSTIGWYAVAIASGALAGLAIGHWTMVSGWFGRFLQDPTMPPSAADQRDVPATKPVGKTS